MRNEERKKKLKRLLLILTIILSAALTVFVGFQVFNRSVINKFEIEADNLTCTDRDQVLNFVKKSDLKYFTFRKEDLEKSLKKKFFCIGKMDIQLNYPDRIKVKAFGREPVFILVPLNTQFDTNPVVDLSDDFKIATQSSMAAQPLKVIDNFISGINESSESGKFLVDEEGVVFDSLSGQLSFPKLQIVGMDIKVGGKIEGDLIRKTREVSEGLKTMELPTDNMIILGNKLIINSKPRIIFVLDKRLDYQIASLQLILAQAKMNSDPSRPGTDDVESIDLRFNKPVVVYSKTKK